MGLLQKIRKLLGRRDGERTGPGDPVRRDPPNDPAAVQRALVELGLQPATPAPSSPAGASPEELNLRISQLGPRVETTGDPRELDDLIEAIEGLLAFRVLRPADQSSLLRKLAWALNLRVQASGRRSDLDRQVAAWEEIVELTPEGPTIWDSANLATALKERHVHTGERGDLDLAIDIYSRILDDVSSGDPRRRVLLTNLGSAFRMRHEQTGSPADLDRGIAFYEEAVGPDFETGDVETASVVRNNLANALADRAKCTGDLGDLNRALDLFREAIDLSPEGSLQRAGFHINFAKGLVDRYDLTGDPEDIDRAREAIELGGQAGALGPLHRMDGLNSIGARLLRRYVKSASVTDLDEAISAFERALSEPSEAGEIRSQVLSNLSAALRDRADLLGEGAAAERSVEAAREALEIEPDSAAAWTNLGNALRCRAAARGSLVDLDEAIHCYRSACAVDETDPLYQNNLGVELRERFRRSGRREDLLESIELFEQAVGSAPASSPELPRSLSNLGRALTLLDPEAHRAKIGAVYRQAAVDGLELSTSIALGAAFRWEKWAVAEGDWQLAVEASSVAEEAVDRIIRSQHLRGQKEAWLAKIQGLAARSAYARVRMGDPAAATAALERGLARLLAEALEQHRIELEDVRRDHPAIYRRYRTAAVRVAHLEGRILTPALEESENAGSRPSAHTSLASVRAAHADLNEAIAEIRRLPDHTSLFSPPGADDVQAPLTGSERVDAVVYLAVLPEGSLVLYVTAGEVEAEVLDLGEDELRGALADFDLAAASEPTPAYERLLELLGARLMDAVAAHLVARSARRVALVPVGWLGNLPLHASHCPSLGPAEHFLDHFTVTFAPSARSLAVAQRSARRKPDASFLVGVGNPLPSDAPLPAAASEVAEVGRRFADRSHVLVGRSATREAVLESLDRASHLHFACHGHFSPRTPLESGLVLAAGRKLSLRDLLDGSAQPAAARLAVLSACDTAAREMWRLPEEVVGLPVGFLQAGVPAVVGSLWPVDDLSTALLMVRFYQIHVGNGEAPGGAVPPAEALIAAQRWLRGLSGADLNSFLADHPAFADLPRPPPGPAPFASPFHWAAFVCLGA